MYLPYQWQLFLFKIYSIIHFILIDVTLTPNFAKLPSWSICFDNESQMRDATEFQTLFSPRWSSIANTACVFHILCCRHSQIARHWCYYRRIAWEAHLFTFPPTPSTAPFLCEVSKKCHTTSASLWFSLWWARLVKLNLFFYWLTATSEK
jgi:hypothetical protein